MKLFSNNNKTAYQTSYYEQNSSDSIIDANGLYDFEHFSVAETNTIMTVLDAVKKKYPKKHQGIGLAMEAYSIVYKPRYILNEIIVLRYSESKSPLDQLAVGIAYTTKGAQFRKHALIHFEKAVGSLRNKDYRIIKNVFSKKYIYNTMSELYENEHDYMNALKYLDYVLRNTESPEPYYYVRKGNVYRKMDINTCVNYYENLFSKYPGLKPYLLKELNNAIALREKGYVYKPRKHITDEKEIELEIRINKAAKRFFYELQFVNICR